MTAPTLSAIEPRQGSSTLRTDVLTVLALALGLRLLFAALTADTYDYDEFVLLLLGRDFAHGLVPYRDFMFFHPPGVLVLLRGLEPVTALWWPAARAVMTLVDSVTAALVYGLGRELWGRREGLAAGVLYAVSPLALVSAVRVGQDPIITMLGAAGLLLLLSSRSVACTLLAGVCLGLAVWFKYPALILVPVYVLAAPRRIAIWLPAAVLSSAALFLAFAPELGALYRDTVVFQQARWHMNTSQKLETVGLYWLAANALAPVAACRARNPLWLLIGFGMGGIFLAASQVYYHYFVPIVPFAALLAAPLALRLLRLPARALGAAVLATTLAWAAVIDLGGPSPLFVTAAHFSAIRPTIAWLDRVTGPQQSVLGDRYEYAFLARRPALAHYFWNVGVLVDAAYLEARVGQAGAVVLSYGASSGYPAGFVAHLDARYRPVRLPANTVWRIPRS